MNDYERVRSKKNFCTDTKDMFGHVLSVGDVVVKAACSGSSAPCLVFCEITKIQEGRVFLDGNKIPIQYPGRCLKYNCLEVKNKS